MTPCRSVAGVAVLLLVSSCAPPPPPAPSSFFAMGRNIDMMGCPPFVGPHIAGRAGTIGTVKVKLTLNGDGSVQDPHITSEDPSGVGLGQIALEGLSRCHLAPKIENGVPVTSTKYLQLTFSLY